MEIKRPQGRPRLDLPKNMRERRLRRQWREASKRYYIANRELVCQKAKARALRSKEAVAKMATVITE